MKTICVILLMGIMSYVQGEPHDCDPFAINVKTDNPAQRTGYDAKNQELELSELLAKPKFSSYLTQASPSNVPGSNEFCTGPTHGGDCGGVEYAHILHGTYRANRSNMFKGVKFQTTFIGYNKKTEIGTEFSMMVAGANRDDFIFQWVDGTDIKAHVLSQAFPEDNPEKPGATIDPHVLAILKSPFALYFMEVNGSALWVTCDGLYAWVTYPHGITSSNQDTLRAAIASLIEVSKNYKKVDLKIDTIESHMPPQFSNEIIALVKA